MQQLKSFWDGLDARRRLIAGLAAVAIVAGRRRDRADRDRARQGAALLRARRHHGRRGRRRARGRGHRLRGRRHRHPRRSRRPRPHPDDARGEEPAGGRARGLRDPRRALGLRHHQPDVRRRLLARQGGRARPYHHRLARRPRRPRPSRQPGVAALRAHPGRIRLGHRDAWRAASLSRGQAEAIRYLVSSAVAGVAPEAVAVIDAARGVVLAGKDEAPAGNGPSPDRARRDPARQHPAPARGAGRRKAVPSSRSTSTPRWTARRSASARSTPRAASRSAPRPRRTARTPPAPTRASPSPATFPTATSAPTSGNNSRNASDDPRAAELRGLRDPPRAGRASRPGPADQRRGDGRRHRHAPPRTATTTWAPRPEDELETLRQLVQSAMGYDEDRGDVVTISSLALHARAPSRAPSPSAARAFSTRHGGRLIQLGVLAGDRSRADLLRPPPDDEPPPDRRDRRADRPAGAGDAPRGPGAQRGRRRHPRPAGPDRHQDRAAARRHRQPRRGVAPRSSAPGSSRPKPPGSPPDHERLPAGDLLALPTGRRPVAPQPGRGSASRPLREEAWHAGFLAGQAMATEAHLDDQTRLTSDLRRGARRRARDQRGGAPPRRREPRADARGAGRGDRAGPRRRRPRRRDRRPRRARDASRAGRPAAAPLAPEISRPRGGGAPRPRARRRRSRRRRSSCRARRRSSGTRATTISISTPASRKSAPASRRICGAEQQGRGR